MATLPARPNLDHLRRQARNLLRAARAGDPGAADRMGVVSESMTLAAAQLAVAREYGFPSWARLKTEVEARSTDLARLAEEFCEASIRDWTGRAARMLAAAPELDGYNFATAVILGDADRVRLEIARDPGLAIRPDARTAWTPLHAVCASRWHRLDPARADGLLAVARLLLDAGADLHGRVGQWTPLRTAVAGAANPPITELLLERGAEPADHDLYLAGFGDDDHQSLRLLLGHAPDAPGAPGVPEIARQALAAPVSTNDLEGVRLLLDAGADPRRYLNDDGEPAAAVYAAISAGCSTELVELLLAHGAEPGAPGPDGRSPHALATDQGRADLAALLRRFGAADDATEIDRFLSACQRADRAEADRQVAADPGLPGRLTGAQRAEALRHAAEAGNAEAVGLMLDLGFPLEARAEGGVTALHAAAYFGSADVVRMLIGRGADIEARETTWDSTPLECAAVGSGERPASNPRPDWVAAARALTEAGASTEAITLSPDDPKPPSPEVAAVLRSAGVRDAD